MSEPTFRVLRSRRLRLGAVPITTGGALVALAVLFAIPFVPGGVVGSAALHAAAPAAPTSFGLSAAQRMLEQSRGVPNTLTLPASFQARLPHAAISPSGALAIPPLAGPSSTANFALTNSNCATFGVDPPIYPTVMSGTSITQVGGTSTDLEVAGASFTGLFNNSLSTFGCDFRSGDYNPSPFFFTHGATTMWHSTDGGQTWAESFLAQNKTHWLKSTDPAYGDINFGNSVIGSTSSGTLVAADMFVPAAFVNSSTPTDQEFQAPWGVAVSHSTDGGISWSVPTQVYANQAIKNLSAYAGTCGITTTNPYYYWNITEHPTIAVNPSNGVVAVGFDVFRENFDLSTCKVAPTAQAMVALSVNNGVSFGTPFAVGSNVTDTASLTMGPAPTYAISDYFSDFQNQSTTGYSVAVTQSINNGTSWSKPHDAITGLLDPINIASFTSSFGAANYGAPASDSWATSPYKGHAYLAWADNQSGSNQGYPAIEIAASSDGGVTWGTPAYATSTSNHGTVYFEPAVSVEPNGTVWVTFYGLQTNTGSYNVFGVLSKDGGATWTAPFLITDVSSSPGSSISDLGVYGGVAGTANGAYPVWIDCRESGCTTGDTETWAANVHAVQVYSTAPGTFANITTYGVTTQVALPNWQGWDNASMHTVQVPQYVTDYSNPADVYGFTGWSGLSTSTNFDTTVSFAGSGWNLTADYTAEPAAVLKGTFTPNAAGAALKLNNVNLPLTVYNSTAFQYSKSIASGLSYTLVASAPKYTTQSVTIPTSSGGIYWTNFTLTRELGNLSGTVTVTTGSPSDATVTVNNTAVSGINPTTGFFSLQKPWGWYWVNASGSSSGGLTTYSQYVEVLPGGTTPLTIVLSGGWINGTVEYHSGLVMKVDGTTPVTVNSNGGTFSIAVLGGIHNLTTTAPGYNLSVINGIPVVAGSGTIVNVNLTNQGWISGIILPTTLDLEQSQKALKLHIYNVTSGTGNFVPINTDGSFNFSVLGGRQYTINATATGYTSYQSVAKITAGNGTSLSITLTAITGCTSNCGTKPPTGGGNTSTNNNGLSTTDLILIVVVILLVAVVAAVVLMRGRGGMGGGGNQPDDDQSGGQQGYDDSTYQAPAAPPPPGAG